MSKMRWDLPDLLVDTACTLYYTLAAFLQPWRRRNVWRDPPQAAAPAAREVWRY